MKLDKGPIFGYKATDENICCKGVQFVLNKWYTATGPLKLCENGFHFCENPSGPWVYYNGTGTRIFKVEAKEVLLSVGPGADLKHVARKIRLIEEIAISGDRNTGNWNTGNENTGDRNTGDRNTGDGNTGNGNTGHYHSGCLCFGEAPFFIFNALANRAEVNFGLVYELADKLLSDKPFDCGPYLSLPNASEKIIKKLHKEHIKARKSRRAE